MTDFDKIKQLKILHLMQNGYDIDRYIGMVYYNNIVVDSVWLIYMILL